MPLLEIGSLLIDEDEATKAALWTFIDVIDCPACEHDLPLSAQYCPHCGKKIAWYKAIKDRRPSPREFVEHVYPEERMLQTIEFISGGVIQRLYKKEA